MLVVLLPVPLPLPLLPLLLNTMIRLLVLHSLRVLIPAAVARADPESLVSAPAHAYRLRNKLPHAD